MPCSNTMALSSERQSARISKKIKKGGLDQRSAKPVEQQQFGAAGVQEVKTFKASVSRLKFSQSPTLPSKHLTTHAGTHHSHWRSSRVTTQLQQCMK